MATTGSNPQGEAYERVEEQRPGSAGEPPALIAHDEMKWGPAPDVFPAGAQLCLLHGDPAAEGALLSVRIKASQGYVFAPHNHPHDEHITVISGRLALGSGAMLDRTAARILEPGDYAFLPKEQFHYAWPAADDTVFQVELIGPFAITYARPEDDPRAAGTTH